MRYSRKHLFRLAASALTMCSPLPAPAEVNAPVRVGTTALDGYLEPYYALDKGFFREAGLDVAVQLFSSGARITTAVVAGAIDVGLTNPISIANAVDHGVPVRLFAAGVLYNHDATALCVAATSSIRSVTDLNGKTIGTTALEDSNTLQVRAWIDQNGGDSSTLQFVEMPFSAMPAAVARGTVAAAPIAEPALSAGLREGALRVLAHPMDVYGKQFMIGGWIARSEWLAANTVAARRYAAVMYATARWANAHPDETALILAKYAKMDLAIIRTIRRNRCAEVLVPSMIQGYLDLGYKYKFFSHPLKAADLIAELS